MWADLELTHSSVMLSSAIFLSYNSKSAWLNLWLLTYKAHWLYLPYAFVDSTGTDTLSYRLELSLS